MTGRLEGNPTAYYDRLISQLGNRAKLTEKMVHHFLRVRRKCLGELKDMQQLTEQLQPMPDYLTFSGAVDIQGEERYFCHSARNAFFTRALIEMHQDYEGGRFSTDSNNKIVAADTNALIPVVNKFTPVIESDKVYQLPKDHPGVILYSLAHRVIKKVIQGSGSFEYVVFILAEGINEPIDDISAILH